MKVLPVPDGQGTPRKKP